MRYQVNLASKPFQNRSLFWLGIFAGFGILAFLALQITGSSAELAAEAETLKDKTFQQNKEIDLLKQKQPKIETVNVSQENYEMLRAAHELVGRKALSWTALLSEMERIMPHDVRLLNISVLRTAADKTGERRSAAQQTVVNWLARKVPLTLELATKDDKKITEELLPTLNKQPDRYSAFVVQQQPQPETGEIIFKIEVDYTPPFANTTAPAAPPQGGQR